MVSSGLTCMKRAFSIFHALADKLVTSDLEILEKGSNHWMNLNLSRSTEIDMYENCMMILNNYKVFALLNENCFFLHEKNPRF